MDLFSISQLSRFSGVKAHTIRIWEQRYNALEPNRTEGNTRYYNNMQLRRLLNIVSLSEIGYKVSQICQMPDEEIFRLLEKHSRHTVYDQSQTYFVSQLISAGLDYDELLFEKIFAHCLLRYGMQEVYPQVIYPMLERIGLMWVSDTVPPVQEHFISNILRQKMLTAIDALPVPKSDGDTWLLYLPEGEFHEMGLLYAHYLIRMSGRKVIYLGGNVPLESLSKAVKDIQPDNLLLFLVHHDLPEVVGGYINELIGMYTDQKIYVAAGLKLRQQINTGADVEWLHAIQDLQEELKGSIV